MIKKLASAIIVLSTLLSLFPLVGCGFEKNYSFYPEQSEVAVYGNKNEQTGLWDVDPISLSQAYNETFAIQKTQKLKKGYYSVSVAIASKSISFDYNVSAVFGVYANREALGLKELSNSHFVKEDVLQEFEFCFENPKKQDVTFVLYTTNRVSVSIDKMFVKKIDKARYEGYCLSVKENDKAVFETEKLEEFDQNKLYVFKAKDVVFNLNATQTTYDVLLLASCLQGLVNRNGTHLYVWYNDKPDAYWFEYLSSDQRILDGKSVVEINSVQGLLHTFKDFYSGFCLWETDVPATENVACTIAGVENTLPLRKDGALYDYLSTEEGFSVKKDLCGMFTGKGVIPETQRESSGSAKCDAYLWAKEKYLDEGLTNSTLMAYHLDAFSFEKSGIFNSYYSMSQCFLLNKDYYVKNKAFFWDLTCLDDIVPNDDKTQPLGTDLATLRELLKSQNEMANGEVTVIGGFVPWYIKYTSSAGYGNEGQVAPETSEWTFSRLFGEYYAIKDADAYGQTSLANASIYSQVAKNPEITKREYKTDEQLYNYCVENGYIDENGDVVANNYVCVYMGDYDSSAWIMTNMPQIMNDENLGFVPMCFPINASIYDRAGFVYNYMYEHFADNPNVRFIADHNGYGYLDVVSLNEAQNINGSVESYLDKAVQFNSMYGLSAQGFLIDTWGNPNDVFGKWESLIKPYSEAFPVGVSVTTSAQMPFIDGCFAVQTEEGYVPWTKIVSFPNASNSLKQVNVLLSEFKSIRSVNFKLLRTVVSMPTQLKSVFDDAVSLGAKITALDYEVYYYLAEYHSVRNGNIF